MVANLLVNTQNISCTDIHWSLVGLASINATVYKSNPAYCAFIHKSACGILTNQTTKSLLQDHNLLLILGLVLFVLYGCYTTWKHRKLQKDSKDPKTWPILGSQLEAIRNYDRLVDWITSFFSDDHRTVRMSFLSRRSYLTVDPANVEHILKTGFHNYPKGQESHSRLFDLLGNGILNTDGSIWKSHRKLASLEFSIKKLKRLSATVYTKNALSLSKMLENSSQIVDMQELLLNMTFNSICEVVFGSNVNMSICNDASIANALDNVQEMVTRRYVFPWWRLQKFLNVGSERILHQEITRFNNFLTNVIKQKQSQMRKGAMPKLVTNKMACNYGEDAEDLLSRFLLHQSATMATTVARSSILHTQKESRDEDSKEMKQEKEVREAMMSFVLAGRDTTASTLSWFLYCMCTHPKVQEKVVQELVELEKNYISNIVTQGEDTYNKIGLNHEEQGSGYSFKSRANHMKEFAEKVLSYEALQSSNTPYLHAALAETLRLYPPVPRDGKVALMDDVLPDGTILKAGDQIAYIPYAMGRMSFIWGDDANLFKPERWLSNGAFQPQSPFKFTAFQAGPRMCLGKDAAYLQIKITAALLLRFFHMKLVPNHPIEYRMMMIMTMKYGLKLHVSQRIL